VSAEDFVFGCEEQAPRERVPRRLVVLMAVAGGASVANLYYAQPLLDVIGRSLSVSAETAGLIVTFTQLGYLAGIVALVPLGDMLERRRFVPRVLGLAALALAATAAAPSLPAIAVALVVVGVTSVGAQLLIPFAAALARDDERGTVMGIVMSGVLLGVLLARTVSGLVAEVGGWRLVFGLAAVLMLALAAVLRRALPWHAPSARVGYRGLLGSVARLVRAEPLLRRRMFLSFLGFANFTILWTSLTFLLSDPPFAYGEGTIGLFGLLGIGGAVAAQLAGKIIDRGLVHVLTGIALTGLLLARLVLTQADDSLAVLLAGLVVFDLCQQSALVCHQNVVLNVRNEARGRATTAQVSAALIGGAIGSATAAATYAAGGWQLVNGLAAGLAALALAAWAHERIALRATRQP
jgi:predicted MFS family arabinose efflux permease